jgi:hypothetical protein
MPDQSEPVHENLFSRPADYVSPADRMRSLGTRGQMSYPEPTRPEAHDESRGTPQVIQTYDRPRPDDTPLSPGERLARRNPHNPNYSPRGDTWSSPVEALAASNNPDVGGWNANPPPQPPVDRAGAAGLNVGDPHPPQQPEPTEPTIKPHEDEANFLPGKKPGVTQAGRPGGGGGAGGGGAPRGRLHLGHQSRVEAYDPTLDRADPRNIAIVDESGQGRVNPKQWERAQKGAIDPKAPGERTGEAAAKFTNQYTNALAGATKYMEETFHQKKGDPNQAEGYGAMTFKATGAPDPQVVNDVFKVIDPNNELLPKERMELATRAMHDWYVSRGDTKNADKVAAEMLQHGNKQAQGHGNNALALIKKGDRQGAVAEIQKAYDWLPDGYSADIKGNNLVIANSQGKVLNQIPLDDKMIANLGTGLATGTLYWDVVQNRAGKPGTFAPPQVQPTQAIAATAPGAGGAPASPAGPPPAAAPGGAPPAPAAPPAPPPASAAPPAPQTAGTPSAAPPAGPRPPGAPPPPAAAPPPPPATTSPPQPPPAPPGNRPAAPAPAAPGPATTTQAAPAPPPAAPQVTAQPPQTPSQGGGEPEQKPAIDASVPPPLKGPVQPTTTKRPVVEGEPEKKPAEPAPGAPPASTTPAPAKTEAKPAETKPAKKEVTLVWDKDDPDSIPKRSDTNKPEPYRRRSVDTKPEVRAAQQEIAQADAKYRADQDWLAYKQKTGKSTTEYQRDLAQLKDDIEKTHKTKVERAKAVVAEHKAEQKQMDADEKKELAPHRYTVTERATIGAEVENRLKGYVDKGEKHPLVQNSVLRLADTPEKRTEIRNLVMEVKAHNHWLSDDQVTDHVLTAISHLESDKAGQLQKANDGKGPQASRFRVVGPDLNGNTVIMMGSDKNKAVYLHMPPESLNKIKELKVKSWEEREGKRKQAETAWTNREQLKEDTKELLGAKGKPPGVVEKTFNWMHGKPPPKEL